MHSPTFCFIWTLASLESFAELPKVSDVAEQLISLFCPLCFGSLASGLEVQQLLKHEQ